MHKRLLGTRLGSRTCVALAPRQRTVLNPARLLTTAQLSATPNPFPPPEARKKAADGTLFSPDTWAALQPPPESALHAFAARLGLPKSLPLAQALTHPSFTILHKQNYPTEAAPPTNADMAALGNSLLGLFATEWVNASYPHLPTRVMKAAVSAYVGPKTCGDVAKEWGAAPLLRWFRTPRTPRQPPTLHADALASVPRALLALSFQHYGSLDRARAFVHAHFLSRQVDLRPLIKFRDPKMALVETVAKFGWEKPLSRLLGETGRHSNSPVFVVGVYSSNVKLGEGFGSSLKMAEYRAAEDALLRVYLTRQPSHLVSLPTSTFPARFEPSSTTAETFLKQGKTFAPGTIGESEVLYGSAGRGGPAIGLGRGSGEKEGVVEATRA